MMLHAIHNLELSLKQIPSLGVDVLVLIRRYPDVFSNTSFTRRTGQYKISTLIDLICVWQQMLQHFPDSMLRLDIKDIIQILEKHYKAKTYDPTRYGDSNN